MNSVALQTGAVLPSAEGRPGRWTLWAIFATYRWRILFTYGLFNLENLLRLAQPLVLGFEDVHWAEEPLLDLIEHLADRIDDAPVLIVCLARPELLDARPSWGGGRRRSITIELAPLASSAAQEKPSDFAIGLIP